MISFREDYQVPELKSLSPPNSAMHTWLATLSKFPTEPLRTEENRNKIILHPPLGRFLGLLNGGAIMNGQLLNNKLNLYRGGQSFLL